MKVFSPVTPDYIPRPNAALGGEWYISVEYNQPYVIFGTTSQTRHTGIDGNLPNNKDWHRRVNSAFDGVVRFAGIGRGVSWGNIITIESHDDNGKLLVQRIAHVENMLVKAGDIVVAGQQVASVGDGSGYYRGTGAHLHYDIGITNQLLIDPSYWPGNNSSLILKHFADPKLLLPALAGEVETTRIIVRVITTAGYKLTIRKSASKDSPAIGTLNSDDNVGVLSPPIGSYYPLADREGYIAVEWTSATLSTPVYETRYVNTPDATLRARTGPGSIYSTKYTIAHKTPISILPEVVNGYVQQPDNTWVAVAYLTGSLPADRLVPTIKVGWHVTQDTDIYKILLPYAQRMIGKVAGFVVVSMPELANQLVAMGYTIVYRQFFEADNTFKTDWLNGLSAAQAYDLGYKFYYGAHYASTKLLDKRIFVKMTNEVGYHPLDYAFARGMIAAANEDGRKLALWGDSYGTPEVEQWITRIPALREAAADGHAVALNEYGRCEEKPNGDCVPANYPVSDNLAYESFGGRHELFYDAVPADCRPYLIISETGASNSAIIQPFAVDDSIEYSHKLATRKYGHLVLMLAYYTLGLWEDNNLVSKLPESERKLALIPNPPMSGPPAPIPTPVPSTWQLPFNASLRGIHGNAGGWQPTPAELDKIRQNHIEIVFIATYEQNQAAPTVQAMRAAGVKHFVLRATHRGNWSDFASGSLPRLQEYAAALGGSSNLMIQIHNEPNLVAEGWTIGWRDGAEFASWWLRIADIYRKALPGVRLGFPALSPNNGIPGVKAAESTLALQARAAIEAADWVGVHYYWLHADGSDIVPPVAAWKATYYNKPLVATEVGPANDTPGTAQGYRQAYTMFALARVPMCAWLLSSPTNDFALASWVRQNIIL